jgi:periplasmic mercuric ion binding protein
MRFTKWLTAPAVCGALLLTGMALADTTVEIKKVHLCCGACVKGVATALKDVTGVTGTCDQKAKTVTIVGTDDAAVQKALDALGTAGYYGETASKTLTIKPSPDVPAGKVTTLSLSNAHNCCGQCNASIKKAVKSVSGVTGDTAKAKTAKFDVTGDFEAAAVIKALNDAGFQAQVQK